MILGGAGSLGGVVLGAIVDQRLARGCCATPDHATWSSTSLIARDARREAAAVAVARRRARRARSSFGFAVHAIVDACLAERRPRATASSAAGSAARSTHWVRAPDGPDARSATSRTSRSSPRVLVLTLVRGRVRSSCCSIPTLYLAAFVWENAPRRPSRASTRLILFGAILIALMNVRPQGLLGTRAGGDRLMAERLLELRGRVEELRRPARASTSSTCTSTRARSSA